MAFFKYAKITPFIIKMLFYSFIVIRKRIELEKINFTKMQRKRIIGYLGTRLSCLRALIRIFFVIDSVWFPRPV